MVHVVTLPELYRVDAILSNRLKTAFSKVRDNMYGSYREGTTLSLEYKDDDGSIGLLEGDMDSLVCVGYLSEEDQSKYLHDVKDSPGFVTIDVTSMSDEKFNECFVYSDLSVIDRNGRKFLSALHMKQRREENVIIDEEMQVYFESLSDHALNAEPSKAAVSFQYTCEEVGGFSYQWDKVFSVACCGWPSVASSWAKRGRNWPSHSLVEELTNSVYHLVHKPSPSGDTEVDWRISFSFAESKLMDSITGSRLASFCMLKEIIKKDGKVRHQNIITTYHLKTVFFWACENEMADFWKMEKIDICVHSLLDSLIHASETGVIQHFFIPEINLLANASKDALAQVTKRLVEIKQLIIMEVDHFTPNSDIETLAMMELSWIKVQYEHSQNLLKRRNKEGSNDYRHSLHYHLRCMAAYISDFASVACHAANLKIIDDTKTWYIEETLSCSYSIISAWSDKVNTWVLAYQDLHNLVEDFCEARRFSDTESKITDIELPHGYYRSMTEQREEYPNDFGSLRNQLRIVMIHIMMKPHVLTFSHAQLIDKFSFLVNKIINPDWSEGIWDLDLMVEAVKDILPNFRWSDKGHLSLHQLAQEGVWLFQIPYDTLVQQKAIPDLSLKTCTGNCWKTRANRAKQILFEDKLSDTRMNFCEVISQSVHSIYAEGSQLEYPFFCFMRNLLNIEDFCWYVDGSDSEDESSEVGVYLNNYCILSKVKIEKTSYCVKIRPMLLTIRYNDCFRC